MGTRDNAPTGRHQQQQTGERMDASKLTAEQMEWVCRYPLAQMLRDAQQFLRETTNQRQDSTTIIYANARVQKVAEIYRAVGYWEPLEEFTWERLSAEQEDRGNQ